MASAHAWSPLPRVRPAALEANTAVALASVLPDQAPPGVRSLASVVPRMAAETAAGLDQQAAATSASVVRSLAAEPTQPTAIEAA